MSKGSFTDFETALRSFESGVDEGRYKSGDISEAQIREWIGDANWQALQSGALSWREAQYTSMNSLGFVGYQLGEALLIDLGYYKDDVYYGNGAAKNTWDGTFTGKGGVGSLAKLETGLQEGAILDEFGHSLKIIEAGLKDHGHSLADFLGTTRTYSSGGQQVTVTITLTGVLAAAHLRGADGTLQLLLDDSDSVDENGTSILTYLVKFGGYEPIAEASLLKAFADGKAEALAEKIWGIDFNHDRKGGPIFTKHADTVDGTDLADSLHALKGGDTVRGGDGADVILGGKGDDRLFGGRGTDTLKGGAGADTMTGGVHADRMYAGKGDDRDTFMFTSRHDSGSELATADRIYGFDPKSGHEKTSDKIDLSALHLTWGDISLDDSGANVTVAVAAGGSSKPGVLIEIMDIGHLHRADIIL